MRILLFSADGMEAVAAVDVPGFDELPEAVLWNDRVFVAPALGRAVRLTEMRSGELAFVEAMTLRLELPAGAAS